MLHVVAARLTGQPAGLLPTRFIFVAGGEVNVTPTKEANPHHHGNQVYSFCNIQ